MILKCNIDIQSINGAVKCPSKNKDGYCTAKTMALNVYSGQIMCAEIASLIGEIKTYQEAFAVELEDNEWKEIEDAQKKEEN